MSFLLRYDFCIVKIFKSNELQVQDKKKKKLDLYFENFLQDFI